MHRPMKCLKVNSPCKKNKECANNKCVLYHYNNEKHKRFLCETDHLPLVYQDKDQPKEISYFKIFPEVIKKNRIIH